jgi:hypothetical protein
MYFQQKIVKKYFNLSNMNKTINFSHTEGLLNKADGTFVVVASEKNLYVAELVKLAQNIGLTVSGDLSAKTGKPLGDITNIKKGSVITFGTSSRFDVNWVNDPEYARKKGFCPVYDIVEDWDTIKKAIVAFKENKYGRTMKFDNGASASIHKDFVRIGYDVYPYGKVEKTFTNRDIATIFINLR